jgi:hypothetical protein
MNQPPEPLLFISKFSEVRTVASRNSLYQILAINVALGAEEKAKKWLSPTRIGIGPGPRGEDCYRELPRILLPRTWVNKNRRNGRGEAAFSGEILVGLPRSASLRKRGGYLSSPTPGFVSSSRGAFSVDAASFFAGVA